MQIKLDSFEGIVPRVRPRLLGERQSVVAENVDVRNGSLRPIREPGTVENIAAGQKSLYLHNDEFLTFTGDVDVVRGPIVADAFDRIYFTGDGVPKVLGDDDGVQKIFDLGIPKPTQTPTVTPQQKAEGFTREWNFFYQEPDGRQVDLGTMIEGVNVIEVTPNKVYRVTSFLATFPKVTASVDAIFVMWFEATDPGSGANLGRVYGSISAYTGNNDFVLSGAAATADQENTVDVLFTLKFDTSRASDYTVDRSYVYTFVSVFGEEGPPSEPSIVTAIDPTQDADIGNLQTSVVGNFEIVKKRIYRTVTGTAGATFQFVAEVDIGTPSFLDELDDAQTAEALPSEDFDPPPADLAGIVSMANGFFAAFKAGSKDIYFSFPNFPHAWPTEFIISVDYPIVGLGAQENSLLIVTEGFPYLSTGVTPEFMTLQKLLARHAGVSKRSITNVGNAIAYATNDGVVLNVGADITLMSKKYFTEEEWRLTNPETMIGDFEDDRLFLFSDSTTLIFEFEQERSLLVTTDEAIDGSYNDVETDSLFMIQGSTITKWESGTIIKTMKWRSKVFVFKRVSDFSTGRILSDGYPVTFRLFSDSTQVHEQIVANSDSFTVPVQRQEREWQVEVESAFNVTELLLADRRGLER